MTDQLRLFNQPQTETTSDDWYTPRWIFDALGLTFDLDVSSPPGGPPFVPCRRYYTQEDDGLSSLWEGLVWCNPPYSNPTPWVHKWIAHGNGLLLVVFTKAKWYEALWKSEAAVTYIRQIEFYRPDQGRPSASSWAYGLFALGDRAVEALHRSNLGRVR